MVNDAGFCCDVAGKSRIIFYFLTDLPEIDTQLLHIVTSLPDACSLRIRDSLASGMAWARKSSMPLSAAMAVVVKGGVARNHDGAYADAPQFGKALAYVAFDDVLEVHHAQ